MVPPVDARHREDVGVHSGVGASRRPRLSADAIRLLTAASAIATRFSNGYPSAGARGPDVRREPR